MQEFNTEAALRRHYIEVRSRLNQAPRRKVKPPMQQATAKPEPLVPPPQEPAHTLTVIGQKNTQILLSILKNGPPPFARPLTVARIQDLVCQRYGISKPELIGPQRNLRLVLARHIAMHLVKTLTCKTLPEIGRLFGGKDHTTVLSAVRRIDRYMAADHELAAEIEEIRGLLSA